MCPFIFLIDLAQGSLQGARPRVEKPIEQKPEKPSPALEADSSSDEEVDDGIVSKILQAYGGKLGNYATL